MANKALTQLLSMQRGQCFFCLKPLSAEAASVEHLVAKANGGGDEDGNCVACCTSINQLLGSKPVKEKIQLLLKQKGQCPNGVQRKVTEQGPQAPAKATKFMAECYAKVVANLKQRGNKKPRTVAKLKNTIASLFPKKISPDQVDTLVQQLQTHRVISVDGSKITYA